MFTIADTHEDPTSPPFPVVHLFFPELYADMLSHGGTLRHRAFVSVRPTPALNEAEYPLGRFLVPRSESYGVPVLS